MITELQDQNGKIQTDSEELIKIAQDYYTKLYTPTRTDVIKQQQLLKNIDKKIDATDRQKLDAPLTAEELHTAVYQLHDKKSPGIDGITAEFYKTYWHLEAVKFKIQKFKKQGKNYDHGSKAKS